MNHFKSYPVAFVAFLVLFIPNSYSQYFNIFPSLYDSVPEGFHYQIEGVSEFNDSMMLHVDLLSDSSDLSLIATRLYDFTNPATDTTGLTFDASNDQFLIDMGVFPGNNVLLHMWVTIGDAVKNEVYYKD